MADGIKRSYYKNGGIRGETPYKNDKRDSISKRYYENGNIYGETPYNSAEGTAKVYYENGAVKKEVTLKNGALNGLAKFYFKNGYILEYHYKNGVLQRGFLVSADGRKTPHTDEHVPYFDEVFNY